LSASERQEKLLALKDNVEKQWQAMTFEPCVKLRKVEHFVFHWDAIQSALARNLNFESQLLSVGGKLRINTAQVEGRQVFVGIERNDINVEIENGALKHLQDKLNMKADPQVQYLLQVKPKTYGTAQVEHGEDEKKEEKRDELNEIRIADDIVSGGKCVKLTLEEVQQQKHVIVQWHQDDELKVQLLCKITFLERELWVNSNPLKVMVRPLFSESKLLDDRDKVELARLIPNDYQRGVLLYRASDNGFLANSFHQKCDNKGPTVTLVQAEGVSCVFGGYTPIPWENPWFAHHQNGSDMKMTTESFLFVVGDGRRGKPGIQKYSLINGRRQKEVYECTTYGPTFGNCHDLHIADQCNANTNSFIKLGDTYGNPDERRHPMTEGVHSFKVCQYEVYRLSL